MSLLQFWKSSLYEECGCADSVRCVELTLSSLAKGSHLGPMSGANPSPSTTCRCGRFLWAFFHKPAGMPGGHVGPVDLPQHQLTQLRDKNSSAVSRIDRDHPQGQVTEEMEFPWWFFTHLLWLCGLLSLPKCWKGNRECETHKSLPSCSWPSLLEVASFRKAVQQEKRAEGI